MYEANGILAHQIQYTVYDNNQSGVTANRRGGMEINIHKYMLYCRLFGMERELSRNVTNT